MTMPTSWGSLVSFPLSCGYEVDRGLLEALASFWDPTHCCFSIGEVDLVPTLEEYAELLQLDSPFSETPVIPIQGPRSNRCLEKYLGLTTAVLRPEIARPEETWRKANISLDLLTKYFSRSDFPVKLARDFIAGQEGMEEIPNQCLQDCLRRRQGEGVPMFCTQLLPALVLQSPAAFLPPPDSLITLRGIRSVEALGLIVPSSMECLFLGCGVVRATIPALLFVSLAVFSTRLVLVTWMDAVTFDYIPSEDMWRLLSRIEDYLGKAAFGDSPHRGWCIIHSLVSRSLRVSASTGQPERTVTVLERELEEARAELLSLRLARASEREESAARVESMRSTLHHNSVAAANLRRDLEAQRGNVSTLRAMNEFIREQLEISEDAKDQLEETLAETREQLETEQDIVALRRALDASEEALTSARTSMGAMRVQISVLQGDNGVLQAELDLVHDALESNASWLNQEC
uniref:DUF7745 domain-containing protein n=1 Tax=Fagus sylvatica TaxID=28930 RepID=A0A2N9G4P1_FAGSY